MVNPLAALRYKLMSDLSVPLPLARRLLCLLGGKGLSQLMGCLLLRVGILLNAQ